MKLNDRFDSTNDPFQGDRVLRLQSIPAGARIQYAMAAITPKSAPAPAEPFTEIIDFTSSPPKTWGATRSTRQASPTVQWTEIDFHARRTLDKVGGTNINGSTLQVDFGGVYVEINDRGSIKTPNADETDFPIGNSPAALPGLTVAKFKLTSTSTQTPTIDKVTIRSAPTNISLRFGQMPTFWTRVGEMTQAETTPDFALALQAFLADASPENGVYDVPLIIHCDSIARLQIDLNIEFVIEEDALGGLDSVTMPFDFSGDPGIEPQVLQLALPMNSRLSPTASRARVSGSFAPTTIVYDPMEKVEARAGSPVGSVRSVAPADKIRIAPNLAQAQPVSFDRELSATAIDLLLEVKQTTLLQLDVRNDLDGKPGPDSLLPKAVNFEIPGPVGLENTEKSTAASRWISVALPAELSFKASDAATRRRYWIIAQSIAGEAQWSVSGAQDAPNLIEPIGIQHSIQDGLSWRESAAPKVTAPLAAHFRLRRKTNRFEMPIALQIGEGDQAVRVSLDQLAPKGSVDFALDFDDINEGLEEHLKKRDPVCNEAEHLLNGDFKQWIGIEEASPVSNAPTDQPAEWTLTAGSVKRFVKQGSEETLAMLGLRLLPPDPSNTARLAREEIVESALSQVTPVIASCVYDFSFKAIASDEDAVAEIFWLGETCGATTSESVLVPIKKFVQRDGDFSTTFVNTGGILVESLLLHRVRVTAPPTARQAEVRFSVSDGVLAVITNVSLMSTAETVANGDFRLKDGDKLAGWVSLSDAPVTLPAPTQGGLIKFASAQGSSQIKQTIAVKPDQPFTFVVKKGETILPGASRVLPRVELRWFKADGSKTGSPVVIELDPASFNALLASGTSPSDVASAEIHIFIPPQTSQEIENISLGFPTRTIIPISFVSKSPGQLTVSGWQVGFEAEPGTRPPIPPRGLCTPTPPGSRPGETSDDNCFCKRCKSHQPVANVEMMETESGSSAMVGRCASCGDDMIRFGGRHAAGAATLPVRRIVTPQPILISTTSVEPVPAPIEPSPAPIEPSPAPIAQAELQPIIRPAPAELTPITIIKGIGEWIAEQLAGLGITSLETLAAASPEQIAQVKGISKAQAASFIEQAQTLIGSDK